MGYYNAVTADLDEPRSDLVSHLEELRTRVLRSLVYLCVTATVASIWVKPLYHFIAGPILAGVHAGGGRLNNAGIMDGLMLRLWVAVLVGLVGALPLIYLEVWGFVKPGLTRKERRMVGPLAPVSGVLFLAGVAMAYVITYPSAWWLVSLRMEGTEALLSLNDAVILFLKFYVAFGLAFQLPIVVVLLAALGIVNSRLLTRHWREATVLIFLAAAIITPTRDPLTMTIAALPMVVLYLGTIGFVKRMERRRQRKVAEEKGLGARD